MKYTIEGFSQEVSLRIGLDVKDLVFLRWLVDFYNTGKMEIHIFEGRQYFWLDYNYTLKELPILGINSKDVLARRLKSIADTGVMHFRLFEGAGNKTYYRFDEQMLCELLSSPEVGVSDRNKGGSDPKVGRVSTQKSEPFRPKSRDHIDPSIIDSSINDSKQKPSAALEDVVKKVHAKGFNISQMLARFNNLRNKKKPRYPIPETVVIAVCKQYLESFVKGPPVRDTWAWFTRVLNAEMAKHFAGENIREHQNIKGQPSSISEILAAAQAQGQKG